MTFIAADGVLVEAACPFNLGRLCVSQLFRPKSFRDFSKEVLAGMHISMEDRMRINEVGARARFARVLARWLLVFTMLVAVVPVAAAAPTPQDATPQASTFYELQVAAGAAPVADGPVILSGDATLTVAPAAGIVSARAYLNPASGAIERGFEGLTPTWVDDRAPIANISLDTTSLADGVHSVVVELNLADGRTVVKTARVLVANSGPALVFDAMPLQATLLPGQRVEQAIPILTNASDLVRYTIVSDAGWLRVKSGSPIGDPNRGVAPGSQVIEFNAQDLPPGEYTATLTATAEGMAPAIGTANLVVLAPNTDCSPLNCTDVRVAAPYTLDFSQDHGGLRAGNGVGTGFTWVDKPTGGGTGFIPANLEVDTAAGVLKITTTAGGATGSNNNQDNALGVGIAAADQVSILDTTLVNLPTLAPNFQQAGLWYGIDNDNYLKVVVLYDPAGMRAQFLEERAGATRQQVVSATFPPGTTTVHLRLRGSPVERRMTGYYSFDGVNYTELSTFDVPPALFNADAAGIDPALGTRVFGGVFASHRFAGGPAVFQFDRFSLTAQSIGPSANSFAWDRTSIPFSYPSSLVVAKDGRLYATETWGNIRAIRFNPDLTVASNQVIHTLVGRLVLGITEDPASTATNVILWVAHSDGTMAPDGKFAGAPNSGVVSRFVGPNFQREDIITGLPRALANHSTNSLHFGPDGRLYIAQGGNTGAGAPNVANDEFGDRVEQPLSAALLVADVKAPGFQGNCATPLNSFDVPQSCHVSTYATGFRNMYDFTFHPNGNIYGPDNGLGVNGTYPPSPTPPCTGMGNLAQHDPGIQPDLLNLILPGKYYGHPNPYRNECVFKSGVWQGVPPLPNFVPPIYTLGMNTSSNGIVAYKGDAFAGQLKGDLLITNYSVGDDIVRVKLSPDGQSVEFAERMVTGFVDPLPLTEGPDGRLYVGEHGSQNSGGKITILTPRPVGSWTTARPLPSSLLDPGSAVINGKLYLVGGKDGVGPKKLLRIFDPAADTWTTGAPLPDTYPAVENPAAVAFNNKLYLFGGSTMPFSGAVNNIAVYDPANNTWTDLPQKLAVARGGATAQVLNNEIWVMGGMSDNGVSLSSVEIFNPGSGSVRSGPSMSLPRDNPGSAALNGKLYVFGGRTRYAMGGEESGTPRSVEMYDPGTGQWTRLMNDMPTGRRTPVVAVLNGKAIVIGGENLNLVFNAAEEFDPADNTWRRLSPMPTPRHGAGGGTIGSKIYVVGGSTAPGIAATAVNEVFSFDGGGPPPNLPFRLFLPLILQRR
jgi:large repetitive protein